MLTSRRWRRCGSCAPALPCGGSLPLRLGGGGGVRRTDLRSRATATPERLKSARSASGIAPKPSVTETEFRSRRAIGSHRCPTAATAANRKPASESLHYWQCEYRKHSLHRECATQTEPLPCRCHRD